MKGSFKRRSAFGVYQSQAKSDAETPEQEEEKPAKTPGVKKRRHEDSTSRTSKKISKLDSTSSKSVNSEETNGKLDSEDHSPEIMDSKQKGKGKLLSKANKLRQSLTMSSRKKKRQGYRSYECNLEKSSSNLTVHSLPANLDSDSGNGQAEHQDPVNSQQGETEADRLFSWLISPVKPGKFFRYMRMIYTVHASPKKP